MRFWLVLCLFSLFVLLLSLILYTFLSINKKQEQYFTFAPSHVSVPGDAEFATWNASQNTFMINHQSFFPIGMNIKWLGLEVSNGEHCFVPPSYQKIENVIQQAKKMNATVIRSHTLGFSAFSPNSLLPNPSSSESVPINEKAWDAIDYSIFQCKQNGLRVIVPLLDQYCFYNGNYNIFVHSSDSDSNFFTSALARQRLKNYLKEYLNHVNTKTGIRNKDEPTIFCLELGNEMGDHCGQMPYPDPQCLQPLQCAYDSSSILVPSTKYLPPSREWVEDIVTYIKSLDPNHLIMSPSDWCIASNEETCGCQDLLDIDGIDIISMHCYISGCPSNLDFFVSMANKVHDKGKAFILGEYNSLYPSYRKGQVLHTNRLEGGCPIIDGDYTCPFLDMLTEKEKDGTINGEFFWDLIVDDTQCDDFSISSDPKYQKLLDVYTTHFAKMAPSPDPPRSCIYSSIDACQKSCGTVPKTTLSILTIGDSITAGYHCNPSSQNCPDCQDSCVSIDNCDFSTCKIVQNVPPCAGCNTYVNNCSNSYQDFLALELLQNHQIQIQIFNHGIKGHTALQHKDVLTPSCNILYGSYIDDNVQQCWTKSFEYDSMDVILLMFGTNDAIVQNLTNCFNNDRDALFNALKQGLSYMIQTLSKKYPSATIFLMRPPYTTADQNYDPVLLNTFYATFSDLADLLHVHYLDLYSLAKEYEKTSTKPIFCDGVHPYNSFNQFIGEWIATEIQKYFTFAPHSNPGIHCERCDSLCEDIL